LKIKKKKTKQKIYRKAISGDSKVVANGGLIAATAGVAANDPSIAATFVLLVLS
jgi:preprotein translocase subunit YajC